MPNKNHDFNFIGKRKIFYIISSIIIIAGLISFFVQGMNKGLDFTGGEIFQIKFNNDVSLPQMRSVVEEYTTSTPSIKATNENEFSIRTIDLGEIKSNKMIAEMKAKFGDLTVVQNQRIGPIIGQELITNAIWALVLALVLMLIYITIRFQFYFAIAAIVPLIHDVLVTVGLFSIFQVEVDSTFVAAILTILGYSIIGTVVVFDRIRENMRSSKANIAQITNDSINETLGRTINTVVAVIILVLSLLFLGGESTRSFCLALFIGFATGAYTSIFIAGGILTDLMNHFGNKPKTAKAPVKGNNKAKNPVKVK